MDYIYSIGTISIGKHCITYVTTCATWIKRNCRKGILRFQENKSALKVPLNSVAQMPKTTVWCYQVRAVKEITPVIYVGATTLWKSDISTRHHLGRVMCMRKEHKYCWFNIYHGYIPRDNAYSPTVTRVKLWSDFSPTYSTPYLAI